MKVILGRMAALFPAGSLARRLVLRLFPAVIALVFIDIGVTWAITHKINMEAWVLRDIFWAVVVSQILLMSVFAWVLVSGVRSGLASVNRLSKEITQRSVDDL